MTSQIFMRILKFNKVQFKKNKINKLIVVFKQKIILFSKKIMIYQNHFKIILIIKNSTRIKKKLLLFKIINRLPMNFKLFKQNKKIKLAEIKN